MAAIAGESRKSCRRFPTTPKIVKRPSNTKRARNFPAIAVERQRSGNFLDSIKMVPRLHAVDEGTLARAHQLALKTNQFNLRSVALLARGDCRARGRSAEHVRARVLVGHLRRSRTRGSSDLPGDRARNRFPRHAADELPRARQAFRVVGARVRGGPAARARHPPLGCRVHPDRPKRDVRRDPRTAQLLAARERIAPPELEAIAAPGGRTGTRYVIDLETEAIPNDVAWQVSDAAGNGGGSQGAAFGA